MKKVLIIIFIAIAFACSEENNTKDQVNNAPEEKSNVIKLTEKQKVTANIKTGTPEMKNISQTIFCTGNIEALPQHIATISPMMGGFVKNLNFYPGDNVKKGDLLATLEHPDFLTLQEQYLQAKSQMEYYKEEYKRQGELTVENAASIKKMQRAKADYMNSEAAYNSTKAQLELLHANIQAIEKGNVIKQFQILAPINGIVANLKANIGQFIPPEDYIYKIINDDHLLLHLNVFEKDISKLKPGQKIIFSSLNSPNQYETKVKRVGIDINRENRSTIVHGMIANDHHQLKPGMFVNAKILFDKKEVLTVPEEAIVETEEHSYILIEQQGNYIIKQIQKGIQQDGYCEILPEDWLKMDTKIIIDGSYYLFSIAQLSE